MANRVHDQFEQLRGLIAAQHRDCLAQKHELRTVRAAIRRSRQFLQELDKQQGIYTEPFAPVPPKRPQL
jgi:hypothetical protein